MFGRELEGNQDTRCARPAAPEMGEDMFGRTQGSSFLATLGWMLQSRWDCKAHDALCSIRKFISRIASKEQSPTYNYSSRE